MYPLIKVAVSALLIVLVSEVSKRWPGFGGLIASLPLLSVLAMLWLWYDTHDSELLANHSLATLWFVLPSLPMFALIPWLLRRQVDFPIALALGCLLTIGLYTAMVLTLRRFGVSL